MRIRTFIALAVLGASSCNLFDSSSTTTDQPDTGSLDVGSNPDDSGAGTDDSGSAADQNPDPPDMATPDLAGQDMGGQDIGTPGDMTTADMNTADMNTGDMACLPLTDAQICSNGGSCGLLTAADDGCGSTRDVDCGRCSNAFEGCHANVCICSETDEDFCARTGAQCGMKSATDLCGDTRSVDCGGCWFGESCTAGSCEITTAGTEYYVATTGDDTNAGTMSAPWRHIWHATGVAQAGDTIWVRGGTYTEVDASFSNSGTANAPITLAGYPGETAIIDGDYGVWIDKSYIRVDRLTFRDVPAAFGGENAHYVTLSNLVVQNPAGAPSVESSMAYFGNSSFIRLIGNSFGSWTGQVLLELDDTDRLLIEGNTFAGSDADAIHADGSSRLALRNNQFTSPSGGGIQIHAWNGTSDSNLIEGNTFEFMSAQAIYANGTHDLIRRNQIVTTGLTPIGVGAWEIEDEWLDGVVAHNTITDGNTDGEDAGAVWFGDDDLTGNFRGGLGLQNNIMWDNHPTSAGDVFQLTVVVTASGSPYEPLGGIRVVSNLMEDPRSASCTQAVNASNLTSGDCPIFVADLANASFGWFQANYSAEFSNTISANPLFTTFNLGSRTFDLTLAALSPAVDAGAVASRTVGAGSGVNIAVENVGFFRDDFDGLLPREQVVVGSELVAIIGINRGTNTLTIDRSISWQDGAPVTQPYRGLAPDIGAIESH